MTGLYLELSGRIRDELTKLDLLVKKIQDTWIRFNNLQHDKDVYLDSVALNLHAFYSGFEKLFELIARHIDRDLPKGEYWHRDLLQQMAQDLPEVRPAVISSETTIFMDESRRFRHLVRNAYTFTLDPEMIRPLIENLPEAYPKVKAELSYFSDFLEELARANK